MNKKCKISNVPLQYCLKQQIKTVFQIIFKCSSDKSCFNFSIDGQSYFLIFFSSNIHFWHHNYNFLPLGGDVSVIGLRVTT